MNYLKENELFCRANCAISYIYGTLLTFSIQKNPNQNHPKLELLSSPGLKTLIDSQSPSSHIIHSYMISSKPLTRTTSTSLTNSSSYDHFSWSSISDDMIGTESGVCLGSSSFDQKIMENNNNNTVPFHRKNQRRNETKKTYPPPIPLLARRGNLPGYRPWSLTRRYVDGRLILTEERVKHHEYFEACRENGRLILNLVSFRDAEDDEEEEEEYEEEAELEELELIREDEENEKEDDQEEEEEEEMEEAFSGFCSVAKPSLEYEMERINGGRKMKEPYFSCNVNAHRINGDHGFIMSPSSSSTIPPMATVV